MAETTDKRLCDALADQLAQLAGGCATAADVAGKLAVAGVTGKRADQCGCPVVNWLYLAIQPPPEWQIRAGIDIAEVLAGDVLDGLYPVAVAEIPNVIASFMVAFDDEREFPKLEARSPQPVS